MRKGKDATVGGLETETCKHCTGDSPFKDVPTPPVVSPHPQSCPHTPSRVPTPTSRVPTPAKEGRKLKGVPEPATVQTRVYRVYCGQLNTFQ